MPMLASLLAAVLPMSLYLILIWRMDKYEREPLIFVVVHFIWGAIGAVILGTIGSLFLTLINGSSQNSTLIQTIFYAPFSEEISKGIFLLYSVNSKKFDNITDGLVYGSAIGLGFGMTENFIYFVSYGDSIQSWFQIVIIRSLFSAVMHAISTGTFGAFLATAKFSSTLGKKLLPFIGIIVSMIIHLMWNSLVSFEVTYFYGFIYMIFLILFFIFIFRLSLRNEKTIIENELFEESVNGVIPESHLDVLGSHLRYSRGWISDDVRKMYARAAVRLAFSKNQFRKSKDSNKNYYSLEIERNREIIRSILSENI